MRNCKNCNYCHWELDGAGDDIDYRCIRDIYPKFVEPTDCCDCWRKKEERRKKMIYITSDLHFGHDREFVYGPRGFKNIAEHDEAIIERWNSIVQPEDEVYILGDLMLGDNKHGIECLSRLNGVKNFIRGNHDTDKRLPLYMDEQTANIAYCGDATTLKYRGYHFYLSHYPTYTGNLEKESLKQMTLNLYGHTHQQTNFFEDRPYMYHVGVDSHDCYPVALDDIIEEMHAKVKECVDML